MKGNQMKMRETLLVVRDALDTISAHKNDIEFVRAWIAQTKEAVQEALSAPARQCDVGAAEEQSDRFEDYCMEHKNGGSCHECSFNDNLNMCALEWAQMPYEAEKGGAK